MSRFGWWKRAVLTRARFWDNKGFCPSWSRNNCYWLSRPWSHFRRRRRNRSYRSCSCRAIRTIAPRLATQLLCWSLNFQAMKTNSDAKLLFHKTVAQATCKHNTIDTITSKFWCMAWKMELIGKPVDNIINRPGVDIWKLWRGGSSRHPGSWKHWRCGDLLWIIGCVVALNQHFYISTRKLPQKNISAHDTYMYTRTPVQ